MESENDRRGQEEFGVVMATIASIRRNVKGRNFFPALDPEEREGFVGETLDAVGKAFEAIGIPHISLDGVKETGDAIEYDDVQSMGLVPEMPLPLGERTGFVFDDERAVQPSPLRRRLAATCGVEDHIQMTAGAIGLDPESAWALLDKLDTAVNDRVEYAFRRDIGYLTADASRAGSTLDLSVFVIPIGLDIANRAEETVREMRSRGCVFDKNGMVPGLFSGLCKVSCNGGRNRREAGVAHSFRRTIEELVERELEARDELFDDGYSFLVDAVSRDLATLKNAFAITADEAIAKLWTVDYGLASDILRGSCRYGIRDMIAFMRSPQFALAYCKSSSKSETWEIFNGLFSSDQDERNDAEDEMDIRRAEFLRGALRNIRVAQGFSL